MNILLWILQSLLALHTAMGAVWKFSHSERAVPSLQTIPHGLWLTLAVVELLCSLALLFPAMARSLAVLAPIAAIVIATEMLLFCGVHLASKAPEHGHLVYWLVVAGLCAFTAYGRFALQPL
jgi:hypothetical protein